MSGIPTSLRIAICFIVALWIVGLIAFAVGAPGEIVLATAVLGTVAALVEWSSHRPEPPPALHEVAAADMASATTELQGEPAPATSHPQDPLKPQSGALPRIVADRARYPVTEIRQ